MSGDTGSARPKAGRVGPAAPNQQRLWLAGRLHPGNWSYHIASSLELTGDLPVAVLRRALGDLVRRHDVLRTTFEEAGGELRMCVADSAAARLDVVDLRSEPDPEAAAEEATAAVRREPTDLETGPLFRALLCRTADDRHVLTLHVHHILADGWTLGLLWEELGLLFGRRLGEVVTLPPTGVAYTQWAAERHAEQGSPAAEKELHEWLHRLGGLDSDNSLRTDRPRPAVPSFRGRTLQLPMPTGLTAALRETARSRGRSLFMLLCAGFAATLGHYDRREEVVVAVQSSGRADPRVARTAGFFVNTLPMRFDLGGSPSLGHLVEQAREGTLAVSAAEHVTYEQLTQRTGASGDLSMNPLAQVAFQLMSVPIPPVRFRGLRTRRWWDTTAAAKFDLGLMMVPAAGDDLTALFSYSEELFDESTVREIWQAYLRVLAELAADPGTALWEVPLLGADRRREAAAVSRGPALPAAPPSRPARLLAALAEAARTPSDRPAVTSGPRSLTRADLWERAGHLARALRAAAPGSLPDPAAPGLLPDPADGSASPDRPGPGGPGPHPAPGGGSVAGGPARVRAPGGVVLVSCPDRMDTLTAVLGAWRAGAAVLVAEEGPASPRTVDLVRRLGVALGVGTPDTDPRGLDGVRWLDVADRTGDPSPPPDDWALGDDDTAYVISTSGTTGRPRSVPARMGAFGGYVIRQAAALPAEATVAQVPPLGYDPGMRDTFTALAAGARLVIPERIASDPVEALAGVLAEGGADTVLAVVPSILEAVCRRLDEQGAAPRTRLLRCCGEALPRATAVLARRVLGQVPHNDYGPSEATMVSVSGHTDPDRAHGSLMPIGRPEPGVRALVLGPGGHLLPPGFTGEIHLAGPHLAPGYLDSADPSDSPFLAHPDGPLYRTGDLGHHDADGLLHWSGRADRQTKVRGVRVDVVEVETALLTHPSVRDAVVAVRGDGPGRRLVAYAVAADGTTGTALRDHLRALLPRPAVPSVVELLPAIERGPRGKVRWSLLPEPTAAPTGRRPAQDATERRIAEVWQEVLATEHITGSDDFFSLLGSDDDFFDLGGHSLAAMRMAARVAELTGCPVTVQHVFEHPTLAEFAGLVRSLTSDVPAPAPGADR